MIEKIADTIIFTMLVVGFLYVVYWLIMCYGEPRKPEP